MHLWLEDCPLRLLLHQLGQSSSRVHGKLLRICAFCGDPFLPLSASETADKRRPLPLAKAFESC